MRTVRPTPRRRTRAIACGVALLSLGGAGCPESERAAAPPADESPPPAEESAPPPSDEGAPPPSDGAPDAAEAPPPAPAPPSLAPAPQSPAPAAPPAASPAPEPAATLPEPAAHLSLDELGDRIKETPAIGVFTKLALKNDIDDLLAALRAHHDRGEGSLAAHREHFEALVLKLLTLLEPDEPELALALARSQEEIWSRLADPVRFAELTP